MSRFIQVFRWVVQLVQRLVQPCSPALQYSSLKEISCTLGVFTEKILTSYSHPLRPEGDEENASEDPSFSLYMCVGSKRMPACACSDRFWGFAGTAVPAGR